GRGTNDNVREQCAVDELNLGLANDFLPDLGAASGIGAIIFYEDLHRSAVDATRLINELHGSSRGAFIPAAIGSADAGTVALEADTDGLGRLRLRIAHETRRGEQRSSGGNALQYCATGQSVASLDTVPDVVHSLPCSLILKSASVRLLNGAQQTIKRILSQREIVIRDQPIEGVERSQSPKTV